MKPRCARPVSGGLIRMRWVAFSGAALLALSTLLPAIGHERDGPRRGESHRGSHSLFELAYPEQPCCPPRRFEAHVSSLGSELPLAGKEFHVLLIFAAVSVVLVAFQRAQYLWIFTMVFAAELALAAGTLGEHASGHVLPWSWGAAALGLLLVSAVSVDSMLVRRVRGVVRPLDIRAFD